MAGSGDPPGFKRGRGRPLGAVDKTRDYRGAVAKMLALIEGGASARKASRAVGEETSIPVSTLRKHLAKEPEPSRPLDVHLALADLMSQLRVATPEEVEEATKRHFEESRKKEAERAAARERQQEDYLYQLNPIRLPRTKKRSK